MYHTTSDHVYLSYFEGGRGLTVSTALYSIVNMNLPQSPDNSYIYSIDKLAKRALQGLPPSANGTDINAW
jgi:hypothetical protein